MVVLIPPERKPTKKRNRDRKKVTLGGQTDVILNPKLKDSELHERMRRIVCKIIQRRNRRLTTDKSVGELPKLPPMNIKSENAMPRPGRRQAGALAPR
jgi:hypothetical protein